MQRAVELDVRLLGHANVAAAGTPIKFAKRAVTLAMLAFLILKRGQPIGRSALAFTLFPDESEENALSGLRRYLSLANKALPERDGEPWLIADGETVRWNVAGGALVDAIEFERLAMNPASAAQAVDLYCGDLLEDVYDDWVVAERERLRALYLQTLADLIARHRSAREHSAALGYAHRLLAADPWREDVVREAMAIRYASGNSSGAIAEYERYAERLKTEMRIAPMAETLAVREAILRDDPLVGSVDRAPEANADGASRTHVLPFVGRQEERARVEARWDRAARGYGGVVAIGGEAGVGKTRFVGEIARLAEAQGGRVFAGGTSYRESVPYQCIVEALRAALPVLSGRPIDPLFAAVLATILPELRSTTRELPDVVPLAPEREAARLFDALARAVESLASPRPLLLIFEDLHWAAGATIDAIAAIARRIDRTHVMLVATYREEDTPAPHPLRRLLAALGDERRTTEVHLGRFSRDDVARAIGSVDALAAHGDGLVDRLFAFSEGNALFLNEAIAAVLEGAADVSNPGTAAPTRGIGEVVASRTARLGDEARTVAEIAAMCGQGCSVDIVREAAGLSAAQTLEAFNELLDRRLMREAGARERFDYVFTHHLIGRSIYERVDDALRARRHARIAHVIAQREGGDSDFVRDLARHYDLAGLPEPAALWYGRAAAKAVEVYANEDAVRFASLALEKQSDGASAIEALLVREEANARLGRRDAQLVDLNRLDGMVEGSELRCRTLRRRVLLLRFSDDRAAEEHAIAAMRSEASSSGDRRWQGLAFSAAARLDVALGHYEAAKADAHAALEHLAVAGAPRERIEALTSLIEAHASLSEVAQADRSLELAQSIAREAGDRLAVAQTLMQGVLIALPRQQFERVVTLASEAAQEFRAVGDRGGEAHALANVAAAAVRLSHWEQARAANLGAAQTFEELGDRAGLARVLMNLGMLHGRCGDLATARKLIASAREHQTRLGDQRARTASMLNESFVALWQGKARESKALALAALEAAIEMDHVAFRSHALGNLGAAERDLGEVAQAIAHIDEGLAIQLELGRPPSIASDLADAALARAMGDDLPTAIDLCGQILTIDHSWEQAAVFPPYPPWIVACVFHWAGDPRAASALEWAARLATGFAAAIDVAELRAHFEALPFYIAIAEAGRGRWPERPGSKPEKPHGTPRARRSRTV